MKLVHRWSFSRCLAWSSVLAATCMPAAAQELKYQVVGVVYAPPGSASNVTYGQSTSVGSTNTFTSTNTKASTVTTSLSLGAGLFGTGADITFGLSDEYDVSSANSNSVTMQATKGNSISTMGPISSALGVDHDNDVIYIWLNPVIGATVTTNSSGYPVLNWTGLQSNSCDPYAGPTSVLQGVNGCDPNQYPYPDIVGIPVWCLKNPYYPFPSCSQWLPYTARSWDQSYWGSDPNTGLPLGPGLTLRDYADILQADPFVALNGSAVNVCHPSYGPSLDPNLPETIGSPLTPASGSNYTIPGVAGTWINYANPYDPGYYDVSPFTASNPQPSGFLPKSCSSNLPAASGNGATTAGTVVTRFSPVGTVEYPVPGPNGLPSTYTGSFNSSWAETDGSTATTTNAIGSSVTFGAQWGVGAVGSCFIGCGSFSIGYSNTLTQQQQSALSNTSTKQYSGAYSITGPQLSDNYIGPATYNVYLDKVYGTFAFYSDLEPPATPAILGNLGISINGTACSPTSPTPCLTIPTLNVSTTPSSALYTVTLTNNSTLSPVTMAGPAISFSDPGFQIAPGGTDNCSNQQLAAYSTANNTAGAATPDFCTIPIQFVPTSADAPIAVNGIAESALKYNGPPTQIVGGVPIEVVNAQIVAAGTVNISSTSSVAALQNILETNYTLVSASVSGSSQGATLAPVGVTLSSSNPPPYLYNFGQITASGASEGFILTNNYTFPIAIAKIAYSDAVDFSTKSGTDLCTGTTVQPTKTCTLTVQVVPTLTSPASLLTSISVFGISPVWNNGETFQAASAGAKATTGTVTVSGSNLNASFYLNEGNYCSSDGVPNCGIWQGSPGIVTVANSTSAAVSLTVTATGGIFASNTCGTSLASGGQCSYSFSDGPGCSPPSSGSGDSASCSASASGTVTVAITGGTTYPFSISESSTETNYFAPTSAYVVPVKIAGSEKSTTVKVPATAGTATLTVKATRAKAASKGTLSVKVGNFTAKANYAAGASANQVVNALVSALNAKGSPVKAKAQGSAIALTSTAAGTAGNLALATTGNSTFAISPSGKELTGGKNATASTKYDAGTVAIATHGLSASATWGANSTPHSIAVALAASINKVASAFWKATASGDQVTLTAVSKSAASSNAPASNFANAIALKVTDSAGFNPVSFEAKTAN